MEVKPLHVEAVVMTGAPGLDPITVIWTDHGPGKGEVTITIYGHAWTAWWGAMGSRKIRQFFAECENYYLIDRLGITQFVNPTKGHRAYLGQIIDAIKAELATPADQPAKEHP